MWELIATVASGLEAGAGLHCVLVEVPAGMQRVPDYWALFPKLSSNSTTYSNLLSAVASGCALASYFRGGDASARDPAWLTCALLAGSPVVYNLLVLGPAKAAIDHPGMASQPLAERESWLRSFGVKKMVGVGLSVLAFGAITLVLGTEKEEGAAPGGGARLGGRF